MTAVSPCTRHSRSERGRRAWHAGAAAEASVSAHYARRDYRIAARRWRGAAGEIDLILQRRDQIIFVEVKAAATHEAALARVSARQASRICNAACEYLASAPCGQNTDMRIDVATVSRIGDVRVLENAIAA